MKINGSLKFDASGLSQIENLRIEKVTTGAFPTWTSNDVGRLVYNTTTQVMWLGGASAWISLATGGDASSLAAEVDALEASLGTLINNDGTFNAAGLGGNLANATSVTNVFTKLQALVATAQSAADGEAARAQGVEQDLQDDIDAEVARATAAEGVLTTGAATEVTNRTNADNALGVRIDNEATAREDGDTTNADAIDAEATRATAAEDALSTRITTEVSDRTNAINTVTGLVSTEATTREAADTALGARIDTEVSDRATAITNLTNQVQSALAGLTWEAPVDFMVTDHTTVTGQATGTRVLDLTDNKIYTVLAGGAYDAGEALVDGAAFFFKPTDVGYVFNGTSVVQFNGASGITAGTGLVKTGNTLNIVSDSNTITVGADSIDVAQSVLDSITQVQTNLTSEVGRATAAEGGLGDRIDDEAAAREAADDALQAAIDAEEAARIAADSANATTAANAVTAEQTRAEAAEGVLTTNLDAEVSRATAAEGTLTTSVTALTNRVNKMYYLYQIDSSTPAASAAVHTVTHNLGVSYCNVTVVDDTNNVVIPESIVFNTPNQLTVSFNSAIACRVVVMGLAAA